MNKTLIIGLDTLAGCNLALTWADRCEVVGLSQLRHFQLDGCRSRPLDSRWEEQIVDLVVEEMPAQIIDCGRASISSWDWRHEEFDAALELRRAEAICRAARCAGSRLTMVSTDAIFPGPRMFSCEKTVVADACATELYRSLRDVEKTFVDSQALVARTHLFGWSPGGESCVENWSTALAEGRPVAASGNRYATPILASDFAVLLWAAQHRRLTGVHHLGGAQRSSMWQFATELAVASGTTLKLRLLETASQPSSSSAQNPAGIGEQESSLDSRHVQRELHIPLPMLREGIERFVEEARSGYRNRVAASLRGLPLATSAA